jgi:predicted nuclease of predicted toxin-antitoxin system
MSTFLANENVPIAAVHLARASGLEMSSIREIQPGAGDDTVLAMSQAEGRVLVTFDRDFGDMAFRHGRQASAGVILLRPRLRDPDYLAQFLLKVLAQNITWEGHFSIAREGQLRVVPLPDIHP